MSMYRTVNRWILAGVAAGLMASGCGDDNNPTSSSGSATVPDHAGANTAITSSNAKQVMLEVSVALNGAMGRVMSAAASKLAAKTSTYAQTTVNNKVVNGLSSGTVTVNNGTFNLGNSGSQTLKADLVFNDFSDDGQTFIGGTVNMDLSMTIPTVDSSNPGAAVSGLEFSFVQKGDLAFSGKYKGTLKMDLTVNLSGGVPSVSGSVTVDGNTVQM